MKTNKPKTPRPKVAAPAAPSKTRRPKDPASASKNPLGLHEERERGHRYAQIIARAWTDNEFKKRLMQEPASVFAEYSLRIPRGHEVRLVSTPPKKPEEKVVYFVLPKKPAGYTELRSRPLTVSVEDDWLERPSTARASAGPCSKCWNGCC